MGQIFYFSGQQWLGAPPIVAAEPAPPILAACCAVICSPRRTIEKRRIRRPMTLCTTRTDRHDHLVVVEKAEVVRRQVSDKGDAGRNCEAARERKNGLPTLDRDGAEYARDSLSRLVGAGAAMQTLPALLLHSW